MTTSLIDHKRNELLGKFSPKPESELTRQDALERLAWVEGVREGRKSKLEYGQVEYDAAEWVTYFSRELLLDIEARDAGRFVDVREPLSLQPCDAKNNRGKPCGARRGAKRVVVWTANGRRTAVFCRGHSDHARHFGTAVCAICASTILRGIPIEKWGRDHWGLFLQVYNLCTNSSGGEAYPDFRLVKCNPERHPDMALERNACQNRTHPAQ